MNNYLTLKEHFLTLPEPFRSKAIRDTASYLTNVAIGVDNALAKSIVLNWDTKPGLLYIYLRKVVKRFESKSVLNE